jgi:hypothetical protein
MEIGIHVFFYLFLSTAADPDPLMTRTFFRDFLGGLGFSKNVQFFQISKGNHKHFTGFKSGIFHSFRI